MIRDMSRAEWVALAAWALLLAGVVGVVLYGWWLE